MTTVKVEKEKNIQWSVLQSVKKHSRRIKQKKKNLHWRDWDIWKYCQITHASRDLKKKNTRYF